MIIIRSKSASVVDGLTFEQLKQPVCVFENELNSVYI
jgi:hypothetical protein